MNTRNFSPGEISHFTVNTKGAEQSSTALIEDPRAVHAGQCGHRPLTDIVTDATTTSHTDGLTYCPRHGRRCVALPRATKLVQDWNEIEA
ncbi:hypothetical protein EVAR_48054_1 [Eumeta japonica]|uniref:Uncharacterized protein n=1 Tax=Eumeta variegata TaxID=151549 RepID=A0A4C1X9N9_EUMVA|nr:hypothetical protein EVAR_48054_1 [Eumeta japonica]